MPGPDWFPSQVAETTAYLSKERFMTDATKMTPRIVTDTEWKAALDHLKTREDEQYSAIDALNAARRELPMVEVTTSYAFGTADGTRSLADLFNGRHQLILYHFMFAPDWDTGCPHCTGYADSLGHLGELHTNDTEFALVSRAPSEKLEAYKAERGWDIPWFSCETRFSEAMDALPEGRDTPAINVFLRDDEGKVYRAYHTSGRAIEFTINVAGLLNLTPMGAQF